MGAPDPNVRNSRRKPREGKQPGFVAAVATGATLAAVVVGGGLLTHKLSGDDTGVVQLDTSGAAGSTAGEGLVDQVPVGADSPEAPVDGLPVAVGETLTMPDIPTLPNLELPDLVAPLGGTGAMPGTPSTPGGAGTPGAAQTPTPEEEPQGGGSIGGGATSAPACPVFDAPATVAVNTVYPGGGAANTVPVADGKLRASRPAFGPCAAATVELPISNGTATGRLGYGAWAVVLEGASPTAEWPVVVVTSDKAVSATANVAGTCPTGITKVAVIATNKALLGLVPTPVISGTVKATPASASGPCQPTPVTIALDLLGKGTASLAPGTWTFSIVGRDLLSSTPTSVVAGEGTSTKSVALVAK